MNKFITISALVMFSLFSVGTALKCYHCAMVDGAISTSRKVCGDTDKMSSSTCTNKGLVPTDVGYMPKEFAKVLGYDVSGVVDFVGKEDELNFKCAKITAENINQNIEGGGASSIEVRVHTCLAETVGNVDAWTRCTTTYSDNCDLCDEDDCNSASGIASSLLLSIVLLGLALFRWH